MEQMLEIVNGWLKDAVLNKEFELSQIIIFIIIAGPLGLLIWKIREILAFFQDVKDSKINELQRILGVHNLPQEIDIGVRDEINRIITYRITGISDVAIQKIIWHILMQNRQIIKIDFFKKFRSFLVIEEQQLIFKKGVSYKIENFIYGFFSIQFLIFAGLSIILSVIRDNQIPIWGHCALYSGAIIMFLFCIYFAKMIPLSKECKILEQSLVTQNNVVRNECN